MTPPELIIPCHIMNSDVLCHCAWCPLFLTCSIFVIKIWIKILILYPLSLTKLIIFFYNVWLSPSIMYLPLYACYNISPPLIVSPPCSLTSKIDLSPPFWHWWQRVLNCNAILGQKWFIYLKENLEICNPVVKCNIQWLVLDCKLCC